MKALAAVLSPLVLVIMGLPFLFVTRSSPQDAIATDCASATATPDAGPADLEPILATIRQRESSGDYQAKASGSTASGAYQYINTTWVNYGGYPEAWLAPPDVQDAKATEHVQGILDAHGGDVEAVPAVWYIGWYPPEGHPTWDTVPAPGAGNVLTPRQYRDEWMATYLEQLDDRTEAAGADGPDGCAIDPRIEGTVLSGGWAYPGPADLFASAAADAPHHDYPAWDWALPEGTPLYAIRGGHVVQVSGSPHNCFDRSDASCNRCGIGVTIEDDTQTRWSYCHGSELHVQEGDTVPAGVLILTSGSSGRSTGPHLHLGIRTADGAARCPQPLLKALQHQDAGVDARDLPAAGCSY